MNYKPQSEQEIHNEQLENMVLKPKPLPPSYGKTRYVEGPIVTVRLSAKPEDFINSPVLFGFQSLMAAQINLVLNPDI